MTNCLKLLFGILILLLVSCANPQAPSGGPPDKTPPKIINYNPKNGTTNFNGKSILLEFDKYMNKSKVIENVFISPPKKLSYDWSGKELEIQFDEELDSNTTYSISIGTDYTDLYQNKPEEAFNLIFSTSSRIDSGIIKGRLYGEELAGSFIYAYNLTGINPDTLNPAFNNPSSRTQVGTSGNFQLSGLKNGTYRIIAIKKKLGGELYDPTLDNFGAYIEDVSINKDSIPFIKMKIGNPVDKTPPLLYNIESISENIIKVNFSEELDTFSIGNNSFIIIDSSTKIEVPIFAAYLSSASSKSVEIFSPISFSKKSKYFLTAKSDSTAAVRDTLGNIVKDTGNTRSFIFSPEIDSMTPKLISLPLKDSTKNVFALPCLSFSFNLGIVQDSIINYLQLIQSQKNTLVPYKIISKSQNIICIEPLSKIENAQWYQISLNLGKLRFLGAKPLKDSILLLHFQTEDTRSYGAASGTLNNFNLSYGKYILTLISKDTKKRYSTTVLESGKWEFPELPQGNYSAEGFCDSFNTGKYFYGEPFPFKFAERFNYFNNEIVIRPRWKIENIVLEMK